MKTASLPKLGRIQRLSNSTRQVGLTSQPFVRNTKTATSVEGALFLAPFNYDYGLCCHNESRHFTEPVFEHFTCAAYHGEGWGAHSFTKLGINWDETEL